MAKNLAELCTNVLWKVKLLSYEVRYLVKQILSGTERTSWFFLTAYNKMLEERGGLKKQLLSKNEPESEDMENSQPVHIAENEKACSADNT